ncbi:hypothetical protein M422DRAFT_242503 [Sphaerobolus stellatus SS14]|nr:hypothetical protein M422DRAFT_242503 [Sphaerobolus stellatus SS14]
MDNLDTLLADPLISTKTTRLILPDVIASPRINRLPSEILDTIFEWSLKIDHSHLYDTSLNSAPLILFLVFHLWKEVALANPNLFTSLVLLGNLQVHPVKTLRFWPINSGSLSIDIHLGPDMWSSDIGMGTETDTPAMMNMKMDFWALLFNNISRRRHLHSPLHASRLQRISFDDALSTNILTTGSANRKIAAPELKTLFVGPRSNAWLYMIQYEPTKLEELKVYHKHNLRHFAKVIRDCINLEVCEFYYLSDDDEVSEAVGDLIVPIYLPKLRYLDLSWDYDVEHVDNFLGLLDVLNLEFLDLSSKVLSASINDGLFSLLNSSGIVAASLQELHLEYIILPLHTLLFVLFKCHFYARLPLCIPDSRMLSS